MMNGFDVVIFDKYYAGWGIGTFFYLYIINHAVHIRKLFLAATLCCMAQFVDAQNRFGMDLGLGVVTGYSPIPNLFSQEIDRSATKAHLYVSAWYHRKIGRYLFVGARTSLCTYDFDFSHKHVPGLFAPTTDTTILTRVVARGTYVSIAPAIDAVLSRRQWLHVFAEPGVVVLVGGNMNSVRYTSAGYNPTVVTPIRSSRSGLNPLMFQLRFGFAEHIRLDKDWHLLCTQAISLPLGCDMVYSDAAGGYHISDGFFIFSVGLMRKYKTYTHSVSGKPPGTSTH